MSCFVVAKYTFLEIYRSKVVIISVCLSVLILFITAMSGEFTYGAPERVALDVGLGAISISALGIGIFLGVSLLHNEIKNRTIYMMLSTPLTRRNFILGRFLGLSMILFMQSFILSVTTLISYFIHKGGNFDQIFWAILLIYFEALISMCIAVLFSLLTNQMLSVVYTLGINFIGHALGSLSGTSLVKNMGLHETISLLKWILPNFNYMNIKNYVIFEKILSFHQVSLIILYSIFYLGFVLTLNCIIFEKKDLN